MRPFIRLRHGSHGNAIVPFHLRSNVWNGQICCSHRNGMIAYQFCFLFRRERYRSVDMFSICLFRLERNGTIAYLSIFRITFLVVPFFRTELFYLKCSRLNATLQRSTFRNNTERSGTIAFPCERDLQHHSEQTTLKQQNTFQKGHTFFGFQFFSLSLQQIPNSSLGLNVHSTTNSII